MVLLKSCVKGQESDSMEGFSSVLSSYKVILFDLDDTLAESKSAIQPPMIDALTRLLASTKVAIIS